MSRTITESLIKEGIKALREAGQQTLAAPDAASKVGLKPTEISKLHRDPTNYGNPAAAIRVWDPIVGPKGLQNRYASPDDVTPVDQYRAFNKLKRNLRDEGIGSSGIPRDVARERMNFIDRQIQSGDPFEGHGVLPYKERNLLSPSTESQIQSVIDTIGRRPKPNLTSRLNLKPK
jgi:hypothetical protein